jgi:hypothetical protein
VGIEQGTDKLDSLNEKLRLLREFTKITGGLHEYQVRHLQMWPPVFFGYDESECHFDYDGKQIVFFLKKNSQHLPKNILNERFKEFQKAVINMVGDFNVIVRTNKKVLYG